MNAYELLRRPDGVPGKVCTGCHRSLPITTFSKHSGIKSGLQPKCKDCVRRQHRAWYLKNRQRKLEQNKAWDEANREQRALISHQSYVRNRELNFARVRQRREDTPEIRAVYLANGKAKAAGVPGRLMVEEWIELKRRYCYTCLACGRSEPEIKLTMDHVIPLSKGGPNTIDNIQPLCVSCNCIKHRKHIDYRPEKKEGFA